MGKVTWERRGETRTAPGVLIPAMKATSLKDFRPPPTIEDDFRRYLQHEVPNVNFTFELIPDWYKTFEEDYEPVYLRAQQTPIDWKSKIGNSDMSTNFKTTHDIPIYKGNIVRREDGKLFMLAWNITLHPNNQATQSTECNAFLSITRMKPREVDDEGYVISPGGTEIVVDELPCVHLEYAGRPDYSVSEGQAGITGNHLITVQMQWNDQTKRVRIGDNFVLGAYTYRVVNVSIAEVDISRTYGVLTINAKRVEGGGIVGE